MTKYTKTFRSMIVEQEDENWSKEDLIQMIMEEDLTFEDIMEITELVEDIVEFGEFDDYSEDELDSVDWDEWDDEDCNCDSSIDEKMTAAAKKTAAKKRRKPAFKKVKRLKAKCMKKYGDKIKKTKNSANPKVCGSDGKLKTGMGRAGKRKLAKTRKRNKNKIIK